MFSIRADLRETRSGIVSALKKINESVGGFELIEEVLTVGDYVIEFGGYVLIIERKAIADLAASIVDRRIYDNHKKLLEAAGSNCGLRFRIMYLIEGKQFNPNDPPDQKVSGIKTSSLQAKLDHLMMLDGCCIEWTKSTSHTASRLIQLGKNMSSLRPITGGDGEQKTDISSIVKKVYVKSVKEVQKDMLMCIYTIGPKRADGMLGKVSFYDIMYKADTGLWDPIVSGIIKDLRENKRPDILKNMLLKIIGVSDTVANTIILATDITLFSLSFTSGDPISTLKKTNGRRIGSVVSNRIYEHLRDGPL
jgi:ERCC4-type nuclease